MAKGPNTTVETMVTILTTPAVVGHRELARKLGLNAKTVARIRRLETQAARDIAKALADGQLK